MKICNPNCKIEMSYIDPTTYTSIVDHEVRKSILKALYRLTRSGPISKQELADGIGIGYHQLVYQLNNQLREFWTVREERKVRGTRMELIEPSMPHAVFIAFGKENNILIVDPLANLFGPLSRTGTRCDTCTEVEAKECMNYVGSKCSCAPMLTGAEMKLLLSNGRKSPFKPMDHAIVCALQGVSEGKRCIITIPCEQCAFLKWATRT
jgi:hypothetical protein